MYLIFGIFSKIIGLKAKRGRSNFVVAMIGGIIGLSQLEPTLWPTMSTLAGRVTRSGDDHSDDLTRKA